MCVCIASPAGAWPRVDICGPMECCQRVDFCHTWAAGIVLTMPPRIENIPTYHAAEAALESMAREWAGSPGRNITGGIIGPPAEPGTIEICGKPDNIDGPASTAARGPVMANDKGKYTCKDCGASGHVEITRDDIKKIVCWACYREKYSYRAYRKRLDNTIQGG